MEATRREPGDSPRPRSVRFLTFGCKVNQYDTQILRERALGSGARESDGDADLIVVNTCAVTGHGAAVARKAVRRLAREHPEARIVVTGCYAVTNREEAAALPNVTAVIGNEDKDRLATLLGGEAADAPFIERTVRGLRGHTRAFVKVQDGCRNRCSYCIVPSVRPDLSSKSPEVVVAEVSDLVRSGHREVVLTGIHLGAYGREGPGPGRGRAIESLLRRLLEETAIERIRLSSLEAAEVTDDLLDLLCGEERLAPHLHLPLQSGSAAILRAMRRRYRPADFLATVDRIRGRRADFALGTDVIAGFPGESDADFGETLDVMRRARFVRTHVFRYSPRPGTAAAALSNPVPEREARIRAEAAEALGAELAVEYLRGLMERPATVLVEERTDGGRLAGLTEHYVRVFLDGPDDLLGRMLPVRYGPPVSGGAEAKR